VALEQGRGVGGLQAVELKKVQELFLVKAD
jgi:hypothetical protein